MNYYIMVCFIPQNLLNWPISRKHKWIRFGWLCIFQTPYELYSQHSCFKSFLWALDLLLFLSRTEGILIHNNSQLFLVLMETHRESTVKLQASSNMCCFPLCFLNLQISIYSLGQGFAFDCVSMCVMIGFLPRIQICSRKDWQ